MSFDTTADTTQGATRCNCAQPRASNPAYLEQLAQRMMVVRSWKYERLLARSQAEGARRHRPRHPKDGGGQDLRGLHAHHREVHRAKKTNRGGGPEALSRTDALHLGHRRRAPCPLEAA